MKLSTGRVEFPIEFDNGDKGSIYFNPNDKDFRNGFFNFENSIEEQVKKIDFDKYKSRFENGLDEKIKIKSYNDILGLDPVHLNKLKERIEVVEEIDKEYQNAIKNELDNIFKSKVSDIIFKHCDPLDIIIVKNEKGKEEREVYIMHFVKQFAKELEKYSAKNNTAIKKYMEKYPKK